MEHNHEIFYDKIDFIIDSSTKAINSIFNNISLAHKDHNSTIFVFQMPRYIGHHDVLLCNKVMIHYTNTDVLTKESFPDNFPVVDIHMDPNDEEKVLFSWRVSINATGHIGSLKFSIEFSCVDEEDVIQWSWNTFEHIGISVKNSQHNSNQIPQIYIDVLEQWKNSGQLKDGYTPVRGVDYWTEQDMSDILSYVEENISGGASSWNDLKDKPFECNSVCIEYDFSANPSIALNDGYMYWYKISDLTPTYEELLGARAVEKYNGEVGYDQILTSEDLNVYEDSLAGFNTPVSSYTIVYKITEMFEVPETGVYYGFVINNVEYLDTTSVSITYDNIKKIEPKYLPDGVPYSKNNTETFLEEITFDGTWHEIYDLEGILEDGSNTNKLIVTLDGIAYEVEKFTYYSEPTTAWGDSRIIPTEEDLNPVDVPFLITATKDYGMFGGGPENVLWNINLPGDIAGSSHTLKIELDGGKTNTMFVKLYANEDDRKLYHDEYFNNPVYKNELKKIVENHFIHLCYDNCIAYPLSVCVLDDQAFGSVSVYDNIPDTAKFFYTAELEDK